MNRSTLKVIVALVTLSTYQLISFAPPSWALIQNKLTYQGRLQENNQPANGDRCVRVQICDNPTQGQGNCYPSTPVNNNVTVQNGLFAVAFDAPTDSGFNLASGSWYLQVSVGQADCFALTPLTPREQLTYSPYALYALQAAQTNSLFAAQGQPGVSVSTSLFITTGNVGIGTTSPAHKLHVSGPGPVTTETHSTDGFATYRLSSGVNGLTNFWDMGFEAASTPGFSPGNFYIWSNILSAGPTGGRVLTINKDTGNVGISTNSPIGLFQVGGGTLTVLSSGKVGIGTTAPGDRLHIKGDPSTATTATHNDSSITLENTRADSGGNAGITFKNPSRSWTVGLAGDGTLGSDKPFFIYDNIATTARMVIKTDGSVGIGTTSPLGRLHVFSNSTTAPYVFVASHNISGYSLVVSTNGNVGIGTNAAYGKLQVAGGVNIGANMLNSPPTNGLAIQGNLGLNYSNSPYRLAIGANGGSGTGGQALYIYDSGVSPTVPMVSVKSNNGSEDALLIMEDGTTYLNGGNVGIGTTSPGSKLTVFNGSIQISTSTGNSGIIFQDGSVQYTAAAGGGNVWLTNGASVYYMNNVGIGTTNPAYKLDVAGDGRIFNANDIPALIFAKNSSDIPGTSGYSSAIVGTLESTARGLSLYTQYQGSYSERMRITGTGNVGISTNSPIGLFQVGGGTLTVLANGNVGIGTTSPGVKLQVEGDIKLPYSGTILTGPARAVAYDSVLGAIAIGETAGSQPLGIYSGGSTAPRIFVQGSSGNVGIGTTAPTARLHISSVPALATDTLLAISTFTAAGKELLVVKGNGYVGIGTTAPGARMEIVGNSNATHLVVKANATQSNANPMIQLRASDNTALLSIHSDNPANTFVGLDAGRVNTAAENTFIGSKAGYSNTTGQYNTALGYQALLTNTSGGNNTALGETTLRLNTTGTGNTAVGLDALQGNTNGNESVAMGVNSLEINTTGSQNTALGTHSLLYNTTGSSNTVVGFRAGNSNSTGNGNVFLGFQAGYNEMGSNKLYIANNAGVPLIYGDFSSGNVGIGTTAPTARLHISSVSALATDTLLAISTVTAAGKELLVVKGNGYVGIGTTNPGAKLDVSGQVKAVGFVPGSGTAASNTLYSNNTPKAWVVFDGTTSGSILSSHGISSVTRDGTGQYTVTFSIPFSGATAWAGSGMCKANGDSFCSVSIVYSSADSANNVVIRTGNHSSSYDSPRVHVVFFGTQ